MNDRTELSDTDRERILKAISWMASRRRNPKEEYDHMKWWDYLKGLKALGLSFEDIFEIYKWCSSKHDITGDITPIVMVEQYERWETEQTGEIRIPKKEKPPEALDLVNEICRKLLSKSMSFAEGADEAQAGWNVLRRVQRYLKDPERYQKRAEEFARRKRLVKNLKAGKYHAA